MNYRVILKRILKGIWEGIKTAFYKIVSSRVNILIAVFFVMLFVILGRLFYLQVIMTDYYQDNFTQKAQKVTYTEGPRGNIYDCDGNLLAHNEICYSVYMTDEIPSSSQKGEIINDIVYKTINLIEENGDSITNDFNIAYSDGKAVFKSDPVTPKITFLCNVFGLKSSKIYENGYDLYSAAEVLEYLCSDEKFDISSETYTLEERIKICTVRYALSLNAYQKYIATEIASDVSEKTQAAILESRAELTGVDIQETYKRVYDMGIYYGSILGYTGKISEDELIDLNQENALGIEYISSDIVGKSGIEESLDAYLQGTRGTQTVYVNSKGSVLEVVSETEAVSGNDVYLTLDSDLQMAYYEILEREIAGLLWPRIVDFDYVAEDGDEIIYVPVKDVYYQLLTNVIEPLDFSNDDATEREKTIYQQFRVKKAEILRNIKAELESYAARPTGELTEEYNAYMFFAYDVLGDEGILNKDIMDTSDSVYIQFTQDEISLREFIMHAISQNWINISGLDSTGGFATSDEIYASIVTKVMEGLEDDVEFEEKIYYYMVYAEEIKPYDICMLLYDQNKLRKSDLMYDSLSSGKVTPYEYIIEEIKNLVITPAMVALDPCSGSIVVTDTKTGKVKALVSYPSYDNNKLSGTIDSDYWYQLNTDASSPLYNRATQAITAPGSTFKPITAIASLEEKIITLDTKITDEGRFTLITPSPKCWIFPENHGNVDVVNAISVSCNYFFYTCGYNLSILDGTYTSLQGLNILEDYATQMGLNMKSGVEIEETSPKFSSTDSVRTAIGQGSSGFTTVQLARYVTCIANNGVNYQLSIVNEVKSKSGEVIYSADPVITSEMDVDQIYWDAVHKGMRSVVTVGGCSDVFSDTEINIAGKTGTAQESKVKSNHSNFIGFSPYVDADEDGLNDEQPEIAFACTIRNGGSSTYAAETTKYCIEYYYGYRTLEEVISSKAFDITIQKVTD